MKTRALMGFFASVGFLTGCASVWINPSGADSMALNEEPARESAPFRGPMAAPPRPTALYIGMAMREVEENWGEPSEVYRAGLDRNSANQKWVYRLNPLDPTGTGSRVVYFENGQVIGWESSH